MRIVGERKLQCPAFANVKVRQNLAPSRLPHVGVPEHITACAREVGGSEQVPVRLRGPVSRAPKRGRDEEAGDESEEDSECDDCEENAGNFECDDAAEASIALDPIHDVKPVKMTQALQSSLAELLRVF